MPTVLFTPPKIKQPTASVLPPKVTTAQYQPVGVTPQASQLDPMAPMAAAPQQSAAGTGQLLGGQDRFSQLYKTNLGDMLTGASYDPFKTANQEALARSEAQQRSSTAANINRLGFTGQGVGDQIANSQESDIRQNRFTQNLEDAKAREAVKQAGMTETRNALNTDQDLRNGEVNIERNRIGVQRDQLGVQQDQQNLQRGEVNIQQDQINLDQNRFALSDAKSKAAGEGFASYSQTHLDLNGMTGVQMLQDQGFKDNVQKLWEAKGGTGEVPAAWAELQYKAATDPRLTNVIAATNYMYDQAAASGAISKEDAQFLKDANTQASTMFLKRNPDTGKIELDYEALDKLKNGGGGDTPKQENKTGLSEETTTALDTTPSQMTDRQVKEVFAAYKNNPDSLKDYVTPNAAQTVKDAAALKYHTGKGSNRWMLKDSEWVTKNTGHFFEINGKLYRLAGAVQPGERNSTPYLKFEDENGSVLKYNNPGGTKASHYNDFPEESQNVNGFIESKTGLKYKGGSWVKQ